MTNIVPTESTREEWAKPVPAPSVAAPPNLIPQTPMLSKQTYASPMSYVGSLRRTTTWIQMFGTTPAKAFLAWTLGLTFVGTMWLIVLPFWYFVTVFMFGFFMIPFRLIRRSHRKQEHVQKAQLATMQAMLVQQQQVLAQHADSRPVS